MPDARDLSQHKPEPRALIKLPGGFVISLSLKFACSYEYLMPTMAESGCDTFRLDLLTGE